MLDPFTIKPLDKKLILDSARATKGRILTVEDHYYEGERARGTWLDIQPQQGSCSPGNPEQLAPGFLLDLRLGLWTSELSGWNGSLDPCPIQETCKGSSLAKSARRLCP